MTYKVLKRFEDKNENSDSHVYNVGDEYPITGGYSGASTKARIAELTNLEYMADDKSTQGPFIEAV